jgi:hypothetical protein
MRLLRTRDNPEYKYTLAFLGRWVVGLWEVGGGIIFFPKPYSSTHYNPVGTHLALAPAPHLTHPSQLPLTPHRL